MSIFKGPIAPGDGVEQIRVILNLGEFLSFSLDKGSRNGFPFVPLAKSCASMVEFLFTSKRDLVGSLIYLEA